jgi:hypothetical protein
MKITGKDLTRLKLPALIFLAATTVSVVLVSLSSGYRERVERELRTQASALQEARNRYQRSGEEREIILRYLPVYQQLQQQGFVGAERRINWLEGLRMANAEAGLFGVDYQLRPQEPFPLADKSNPIAPRLLHSQMSLSMGLVHEGDLMRFLRALAAKQAGLFTLTSCTLERNGLSSTPAPRQANLTAQCKLSWVTVAADEGKS